MNRSTFLVALTILFGVATFVIFLPIPSGRFSKDISKNVVLGSRTKSLNCRVNRSLPDSGCTPGKVAESATVQDICASDYRPAKSGVPAGLANQVYLQYGIYAPSPGEYQIDRLVGESLGGTNDIENLWPQSAEPRPGFNEKDRVERYLHDEVCAGRLSLTDAQNRLASDWLKVFLAMPSF